MIWAHYSILSLLENRFVNMNIQNEGKTPWLQQVMHMQRATFFSKKKCNVPLVSTGEDEMTFARGTFKEISLKQLDDLRKKSPASPACHVLVGPHAIPSTLSPGPTHEPLIFLFPAEIDLLTS